MTELVITDTPHVDAAEVDAVKALMVQLLTQVQEVPTDLALNGLFGAYLNLAEARGVIDKAVAMLVKAGLLIAQHRASAKPGTPVH